MTDREPGELVSIELPTGKQRPRRFIVSILLRCYRIGVIAAVVWLVRDHRVWLRVQGEQPISVGEVAVHLSAAKRLRVDHSADAGLFAIDSQGKMVGYAVKTSPVADTIIGYCGSTDMLVVLDEDRVVTGVSVRDSGDTLRHVEDVKNDRYFLPWFKGRTWEELAELDLEEQGIEGVSGATLTSLCVAEGIAYRLASPRNREASRARFQFRWTDAGMLLVVLLGVAMAFTRLRGNRWIRWCVGLALIVYLGFISGQMISLSILFGWSGGGVPWWTQSGMVLLVAVAIFVPLIWRRPVYCAQICPHGLAQHFIGRLRKPKLHLPRALDRSLRWLAPMLVLLALITSLMVLPIDLTDLEPFEFYVSGLLAIVPAVLAIVGLVASLFLYQPYCKYGCPTGAILNFVRSHGRADRFQRADWVAGGLVLATCMLYWGYPLLNQWFIGR